MAERADNQPAHERRIAEAHFGLRRMHVHIDIRRRQIEKQRHDRMAVARQQILIGAAHRADDQLVLHRAAIDEQVLMLARAAMRTSAGRQSRVIRTSPRH